MMGFYLEAAESDSAIEKQKSWSKVKSAVCLLIFKGRIRWAYTGGFTLFIHSDVMIWEAIFSYFEQFHERIHVL